MTRSKISCLEFSLCDSLGKSVISIRPINVVFTWCLGSAPNCSLLGAARLMNHCVLKSWYTSQLSDRTIVSIGCVRRATAFLRCLRPSVHSFLLPPGRHILVPWTWYDPKMPVFPQYYLETGTWQFLHLGNSAGSGWVDDARASHQHPFSSNTMCVALG